MRIRRGIIVLTLLAGAVRAETVLKRIAWDEIPEETLSKEAVLKAPEGKMGSSWIEVANGDDGIVQINVLVLENPGITSARYAVRGQVKHTDVQGKGYLEMWSNFGDGAAYFSRTLGEQGPMQHLAGTSDWRPTVCQVFDTQASVCGRRGEVPRILVLHR